MKKIIKISILIMIAVFIFAITSYVNAATGSFSVSPTSKTLAKGKTTSITISAKNCAGKFTITSSNASVATVSTSSVFLDSGSTKVTITAKKAGTATITVKAADVADTNAKVLTGSKKVTIKVTDSSSTNQDDTNSADESKDKKDSSNANLSTLGITPKKYDFSGFSANKTSYAVTIPSDVDSLNVSYKTANSKATVKVTGNKNLEVGTNNIKVVVTAEDEKTTKTYTIKVTKLATEEEKPGNIIDDDIDLSLYLTSLSVEGLELTPQFASNVYSYETTIDMDQKDLSEVVVNATPNDENATVEITGNTNLVEGENLINIIIKSSQSSEQVVYQITVNKISKASEIVIGDIIEQFKSMDSRYFYAGIGILVFLILVLIIAIMKSRTHYHSEEEENFNHQEEVQENEQQDEDNLIEKLFNERNEKETTFNHNVEVEDQETLDEIQKENDRIFHEEKGETVEYQQNDESFMEEVPNSEKEDYIEKRMNKRKKGKHF